MHEACEAVLVRGENGETYEYYETVISELLTPLTQGNFNVFKGTEENSNVVYLGPGESDYGTILNKTKNLLVQEKQEPDVACGMRFCEEEDTVFSINAPYLYRRICFA